MKHSKYLMVSITALLVLLIMGTFGYLYLTSLQQQSTENIAEQEFDENMEQRSASDTFTTISEEDRVEAVDRLEGDAVTPMAEAEKEQALDRFAEPVAAMSDEERTRALERMKQL